MIPSPAVLRHVVSDGNLISLHVYQQFNRLKNPGVRQ
jgi:hypothetical protein